MTTLILRLLRLLALASPKLKAQIYDRRTAAELSNQVAPARARYRHCVIFFCSSAGEFEQALPLIDRIQTLGNTYVQTIFFSRSGLEYAKARAETVPCVLAPLTDSIWQWGWLFSALQPTLTCVVRHELWPGFLTTAGRFGKLYLLDASHSQGERQSRLWRLARQLMLSRFDAVFAVSESDRQFFIESYRVSPLKVLVTSDTKYDRVIERARSKPEAVANLRQIFDFSKPKGTQARMVLGSAYLNEVDLLLETMKQRPVDAPTWQIIIVPHILEASYVDEICSKIQQAGFSPSRFSGLREPPETSRFIVVDAMGMLAEIYGTASAALVGGALHHQVHNVLEPASHGLAIAFGPFYKNSQEATHLVNSGLATVVKDASQFGAWWRELDADSDSMRDRMLTATQKLTGASDQVFATWRELLGAP